MQTYKEFLNTKRLVDIPTGFTPSDINQSLFPFQRDVVNWACRRGRAALFEDCGLGKTPQQLEWANQVVEKTGKNVLILAPLGVTRQHVREGKKFGIDVNLVEAQDQIKPGISITNYEKLHRFDVSGFDAVVLDESSILKSFDGKTRQLVTETFKCTPYKLACTATPAPNDHMELGNHAEFLGVMTRAEMLSMFFVHDGGDTSKWRLKGHAEKDFWQWMCSWAVSVSNPSDLGYYDGEFTLPPLVLKEHVIHSSQKVDGYLFALPASTLQERRSARRESIGERVKLAADLATSNSEQWVMWCNLNDESHAITKAIGAEEISGATSEEERERIILGFLDGSIRRVVSKPDIWGFGLNLQCCHNTAYVGLSDSYEQFYQSLRRFYRFGQKSQVNAHVIISSLEGAVLANIKRKGQDAQRMATEMAKHMALFSAAEIKGTSKSETAYKPTVKLTLPNFLTA